MFGWALRASSKLLFFSTRTSSSSAISALLATASVHKSRNFNIVAVEYSAWQRDEGRGHGWLRFRGEAGPYFGAFSALEVGRVAGILCLPLLTWHHAETGGVSRSAHAHLSARKQFVLKCDWIAQSCTWKWKSGAPRSPLRAAPVPRRGKPPVLLSTSFTRTFPLLSPNSDILATSCWTPFVDVRL